MPYRVLVLISRFSHYRFDNHSIIPNALFGNGHTVRIGDIESLAVIGGNVWCSGHTLTQEYHAGVPFPELHLEFGPLTNLDLVWVLANPHPANMVDTFNILYVLNQQIPFVNACSSLFFLNSKLALSAVVPLEHLPRFVASNDYSYLYSRVAEDATHSWVLKPSNEGCGADVFFVNADDTNARALIQSATGNEVPRYEMYGRETIGHSARYVVMQEYVPSVRTCEKRVILAGGEPVCGFRRFLDPSDHRGNVTLGTPFSGLDLTEDESRFCRELGSALMKHGIYFAGVDLAFPYVLELNLANPGGFNYSYKATGQDDSRKAIDLIFSTLQSRGLLSAKAPQYEAPLVPTISGLSHG